MITAAELADLRSAIEYLERYKLMPAARRAAARRALDALAGKVGGNA